MPSLTRSVLIAGWRGWPLAQRHIIVEGVDGYLARIWDEFKPPLVVIHGAAQGADSIAERWAWACEFAVTDRHPADWATCAPGCKPGHRRRNSRGEYCPEAGPRRNAAMVGSRPTPDYGLIFIGPPGKSPGTEDCLRRIVAAGIPHRVYAYRPNREASPG